MAWSAPSSVTTGDLITAATWNQDVVDNAQFLFNERITAIQSKKQDGIYHSHNGTSYGTLSRVMFWYPGSHITLADVDIYMVYMMGVDNASATGYNRLYDFTNSLDITSSEVTSTNNSTVMLPAISAEISGDANWPTTDGYFRIDHKVNNGSYNVRTGRGYLMIVG